MNKPTDLLRHTAAAAMAAILLAGCSTTRRIPDDDQLYLGVKKLEVKAPEGQKVPAEVVEALDEAVAVKPNDCIPFTSIRSPLPIGLWVYNNWPNPPGGLKHWLFETLAADPVLMSDVRPDLRARMLDDLLDKNGYFRSSTSYELNVGRNPKKASVTYRIDAGPAYLLDTIELPPGLTELDLTIDSVASRSRYLRKGMRYSTDSLSAERTRIANALRNRGYYFFRPEYIEYLADSLRNPGHIALRLTVARNTPTQAMRRYYVGRITTIVNRNSGDGTPDTIATRRGTLIQMQPSRFRHSLVDECVTFREGRLFRVRDMDRTQTRLSRLGIFNAINISARPDTAAGRDNNRLDVTVECTFDTPLEVKVEANVSSKSNSYLGPGLSVGVTNRNLFGGGEQLNVTLSGTYEWQTGSGRNSVFNSYEINLQGSLAFPRLLAPRFIPRSRRNLNWTRISLNADLLNRPHYFKMAQFNAALSYDWQISRHASSSLTLPKLTYTKLLHTTAEFDSIMGANEAIAQSFRSQFIPQLIYTYTYDRKFSSASTLNWTFTVQEAGNICWAVWRAAGSHDEKRLFGIPISQFIKASTQLVYGHRLGASDSWLVGRVAVGAAHAYGNSSVVPYSEQFWVGGANSVRAFTVRSIGPGSYHAGTSVGDYFDQTGTFKFEANLEYRFPILGPLHGALFVDAGNVWLLTDDTARPGGKLRASNFLRDLALGTGLGLRFDIGMMVIRGDLGVGIHAPWDTGRRGYYNMPKFGKSLAFHLAIGYPF